MWTYVTRDNLEKYLYKYPIVAENFEEMCLMKTEDKLFFPRYFYKQFPEFMNVFKTEMEPFQTFFKFTGKLRPEQVEIINHIVEEYSKNGFINGIIKARPGLG